MKLISWNVNGIRATVQKGFFDFLHAEQPDILCLQETKAHQEQLDSALLEHEQYKTYWHSGERKGYSGVATFSKDPLEVTYGLGEEKFDREGRVLISKIPAPALKTGYFLLYNIYFPNGGSGPERLAYKMEFYAYVLERFKSHLKEGIPTIICGDFNVAHMDVDLARPKENVKTSGFLPEERAWFDSLLAAGFVDSFRHFHPDAVEQYSWWDQRFRARDRNIGWRIDYFVLSPDLLPFVKKAFILQDVFGSDHCPVGVEFEV